MRRGGTEANRRFINLISFSLFFSVSSRALPVLLHPEAKVTESYSKTQATQNEGQNPCASKDAAADAAAAVAAVAGTCEGPGGSGEEGERERRRDGKAGETKTPEEKRKSIEKRSCREREKE